MSDAYRLGGELRDLLRGFLEGKTTEVSWGPKIKLEGLPDLYAPQRTKRFFPTQGGIDNLALSSTDVFVIPGKGEFKADFSGYFRVARQNPTRDEWAPSEVYVNMIDIRLKGQADGLGPINVSLNPRFVSAGQVFASDGPEAAKACRIAAGVSFEMPELGVTAFNKEPILLMNKGINAIPPVEDPNGVAHLFLLPLYDHRNPDGTPVAYLSSLRYTVGDYITREAADRLRAG